MRRASSVISMLVMLIVLLPESASARTTKIDMLDYVFAPDPVTMALGDTAEWHNFLRQNHNTQDLSALRLWDSELINYQESFSYTFTAAATYAYFCDLHERFGMFGEITVRDRAAPRNGPPGTQFTITMATVDAAEGLVYDVQRRDPGQANFQDWMIGVTAPSEVWDSTGAAPGVYGFRSRIRRTSDNKSTLWSPPTSVTVTGTPGGQPSGVLRAPWARSRPGMAFDPNGGAVLLFGGENTGAYYNDTWLLRGNPWTLQAPPRSPDPRAGQGMAYDPIRDEVVVYGGIDFFGYRTDTWTWGGNRWVKEHSTLVPPQRSNPGMAWDPISERIILFGGYDSRTFYRDTWAWDGAQWTQLHPAQAPPKRADMGMVLDEATGQIVLYGGDGQTFFDDTWTWDGFTWTRLATAVSPGQRYGHAMAYDAARGEVVMFGGRDPGGAFLGDTWTFDGTTWTEETPADTPGQRWYPGMAYDEFNQRVVLFGGAEIGFFGDTWYWDGTNWRLRDGG
jgi:plastocyanin